LSIAKGRENGFIGLPAENREQIILNERGAEFIREYVYNIYKDVRLA
jgi:hypothetical protein